jgi:ABC-type multidrug transport system permease subunit
MKKKDTITCLILYVFSFLFVSIVGGIIVCFSYFFIVSLLLSLSYIILGREVQYFEDVLINYFWIVRYIMLILIVFLPVWFTNIAIEEKTNEEIMKLRQKRERKIL